MIRSSKMDKSRHKSPHNQNPTNESHSYPHSPNYSSNNHTNTNQNTHSQPKYSRCVKNQFSININNYGINPDSQKQNNEFLGQKLEEFKDLFLHTNESSDNQDEGLLPRRTTNFKKTRQPPADAYTEYPVESHSRSLLTLEKQEQDLQTKIIELKNAKRALREKKLKRRPESKPLAHLSNIILGFISTRLKDTFDILSHENSSVKWQKSIQIFNSNLKKKLFFKFRKSVGIYKKIKRDYRNFCRIVKPCFENAIDRNIALGLRQINKTQIRSRKEIAPIKKPNFLKQNSTPQIISTKCATKRPSKKKLDFPKINNENFSTKNLSGLSDED